MCRENLLANVAACQEKAEVSTFSTGSRGCCTLKAMSVPVIHPQRSKVSIVFTSTIRVLFTTLLFTAAGMGAGLFLGIVGTIVYGMMKGSNIDMTNAYKHVAIPVAITLGAAALIGALVLEVRSQRERTSR